MSKQNKPAQHSQSWRQLNQVEPENINFLVFRMIKEVLSFVPAILAFFLVFSLLAIYF